MNGTILLIGVPGVGKTTIGKLASQGIRWKRIDYAELMLLKARKIGLCAPTQDDLLSLSLSSLKQIYDAVDQEIARLSAQERILLETHMVIRRPGLGYWLSTAELLRCYNTKGVIVIVDMPSGIARKREQNKHRHRSSEELAIVDLDQRINLMNAVACCSNLDIPCKVIYNEMGSLDAIDKAVQEILDFIKDLEEYYDSQ